MPCLTGKVRSEKKDGEVEVVSLDSSLGSFLREQKKESIAEKERGGKKIFFKDGKYSVFRLVEIFH